MPEDETAAERTTGAVNTTGIRIVPAAEASDEDIRTVFGTTGDPSRCWCQYFLLPNREWNESTVEDRRGAFFARKGRSPGLVAYRDDEPVGWCAVEPRAHYPRILRSQVLTRADAPDDDPEGTWAVSCFVVRVGHRRSGVAGALIAAAVEWAFEQGARVVEGYPVDPTARKVSAAELYHGSVGLFQRAGFRTVSRPAPGRALVRLTRS